MVGVFFALLFWIFESINHRLQFQTTIFEELFFPTGHELWMRTIIMALFLLFGGVTQLLFNKVRRAEEVTKQTNVELDQIFQTAADGMRVIDRDFNILRVNRTFLTMTGLFKEDVKNQKCYKIFSGEKCFTPDCPLNLIMEGRRRVEYEIDKVRPDGQAVPCIVTATPYMDIEDNLIGIVEDFKDLSKQKLAEAEKAQLEADLLHSQKMEAIGTLAGGIAHDFKNILNGISIYARLLIKDLNPADRQAGYAHEIISGGKQAADLVQQIQTFCKMTEQEQRPTKIDRVVKEALNFLKRSIPSTIKLRQFIVTDIEPVMADATQIYNVVINLCTNAYHAMLADGGILQVKLESVLIKRSIVTKYGILNGGKHLKLTVADTGHGMDESVQRRIFDPYFTTKEPGEGTGLGLSRIHGIVISHNGSISVKSEVNKGAEFTVYLPVLANTNEKEDVEERVAMPAFPTGSGRVLLVDDAVYNARSFELVLREIGYDMTIHTSSSDALEEFRNNPMGFDVVVTDLTMPTLTGIDLSQKLMEIRSDIPIILMTGDSDVIDEEKVKSIGIKELMLKPIDIVALAENIAKFKDHVVSV
jgi:PAS domain S-box-containing protein